MSYVLWLAGGLVHCSEEGIWAELHGVHHHRDEMPIASLLITYTKSLNLPASFHPSKEH